MILVLWVPQYLLVHGKPQLMVFINNSSNMFNPDLPLHITVLHNAALEEARQLAERIEEYNPKELFISIVSPVLGVHTGTGALALCGYNEL